LAKRGITFAKQYWMIMFLKFPKFPMFPKDVPVVPEVPELFDVVWQNRVLHLPNNIVLETTGMIF
jgi:hypothetical protein